MIYYAADFETNNHKDDCRVWSYGLLNIYDDTDYTDGIDLDDFMRKILHKSCTVYFHNLKFDGSFILNWVFRHGYEWTDNRKLDNNQFSTLISDMGQWYSIKIKHKGQTVRIYDSLKILSADLAGVAKSFGIEDKGSIDYDLYRPKGYEPTPEEKYYQRHDCEIMAIAIRHMLDNGYTKITAGSNALSDYVNRVGKQNFDKWYPQLDKELDRYLRKAYRGGWVYCGDLYKQNVTGAGRTYDVNSEYPAMARNKTLPYGTPIPFNGKYDTDVRHPLYVQTLKCKFETRKNHLPTIQIKKSTRFFDTEYVKSSKGEIVELTLSNIDLDLFFKHYKVTRIEWLGGYKFKACKGMFTDYIDYWADEKIRCDLAGDGAGRTLAKLMMNSLIGKFGKRPEGASKIPYLDNGVLKFKLGDKEDRGSLYIPIGIFVLAYAREYIITAAQLNYKRFAYADTDSIHLIGDYPAVGIYEHDTELGAFKMEGRFKRAKYLHAKCYLEDMIEIKGKQKEELNIVCAGLPKSAYDHVTFDSFDIGASYADKMTQKQVVGGAILEKTTFTIKQTIF